MRATQISWGAQTGIWISPPSDALVVQSVRLDDVFADSGVQIAFIKIDTEGNEFEAGAYIVHFTAQR